jgi:hypothetical protein
MRLKSLSRRTVLRGLGGASLALPLLEAMCDERGARAAPAPPKRLLVFYTPGGTIRDAWLPQGSETSFTLGPILAPLAGVQDQLLIVDGLDLKVTVEGHGSPHSRGMGAVLTGQPIGIGPYETCGGKAGFALGPSLDQVVATSLKAGRKLASLEVAVNWPTDRRDGGKAAPTNCLNFSGPNQALPMTIDPRRVWDRLFKRVSLAPAERTVEAAHQLSIIDAVSEEYRQLLPRLGRSDRAKLEEHLSRIQELERSVKAERNAACVAPVAPAALGDTGQGQMGEVGDPEQFNTILDAAMPTLGKSMMDLIATAFACDLTAVATMQWTDSQAYNTFPWLSLYENHHAYQHGHVYAPDVLTRIYAWYAEQFRYMLDALARAGVLDETVVLWVSELQHPQTHAQDNMPFVLAGGGEALRTGRFVSYSNLPHNDLLCAVANLFGLQLESFGKSDYCNGPLTGLS